MSYSESELIGRAQRGDQDAFCLLARLFERRIYVLALHYCRDTHDAEDLSQEVWLKAYRAIAGFREESSFYTWLRQIMINTFLNHQRAAVQRRGDYRSGQRLVDLDAVDLLDHSHASHAAEMENSLHRKILVEKVMQALEELTAQQRLIFLLKHHEGMTYEEISRALGCSTGTIKKSLFRAVTKLRLHLGVNLESNDYVPCAAGEHC
ncbi:MAG TPA: sigma-70 family RNA polymerase sigma factor [Pyrinomonadaceae bacterium]